MPTPTLGAGGTAVRPCGREHALPTCPVPHLARPVTLKPRLHQGLRAPKALVWVLSPRAQGSVGITPNPEPASGRGQGLGLKGTCTSADTAQIYIP